MESDSYTRSSEDSSGNSSVPPVLPPLQAAVPSPSPAAGPLATVPPPPLPEIKTGKSPLMRQFLAILLSLCLGLFLADAVVSLMDDSLILFFGIHALAGLRGVMAFFTLFTA